MPETSIDPGFLQPVTLQHFPAATFPTHRPAPWFTVHLATGGWSPLHVVSGLFTAHMTTFAPRRGVSWHTHQNEETYTWMLDGMLRHSDSAGGSGEIRPGELQRMFAGAGIAHEELSASDEPARFIQIVFIPEPQHAGVAPHYQQLGPSEIPTRQAGAATVRELIGGASPMRQHCAGRLCAVDIATGGSATLAPAQADEDLLAYVTDGAGSLDGGERPIALGQYDVFIARPDAPALTVAAATEPLRLLTFYLPRFVPREPHRI
jgi:redox-sensitive bicupin YhaK (pirin superfamily)